MKMKLFLLFFIVLIFENFVFPQQEHFSDTMRDKIIKSQLYPKFKGKIEKLINEEKKADDMMENADDHYTQLAEYRHELSDIKNPRKRKKILKRGIRVEKKALESRVQSLDSYHDVAVQKYQIYKNDLNKFMKTAKRPKLDSAKLWEKLAYNSFDDADIKIQIAYHTVNQGDLFKIYTNAFKLEQIGLLYQQKIYALFLDWPPVNLTDIDKEILAVQKNIPFYSKKPERLVPENNRIDPIIYQKVFVHDTIIIQKKQKEYVFRVQIAASKKPLNIAILKRIYHADDIINTEVEDGWYKYSVGKFDTYREAKKFKINIGVSDAFIVVYRKGQKVEVSEALKHNKNE